MAERAIPVLRVAHADVALPWYRLLGFEEQWRHQFDPGFPVFVSVQRGDVELYLSEHEGDAVPGTLVWLRVDEFDDLVQAAGARTRDQPWGAEIQLTDPDGNRLRIGPA